jgi:spore coat polysaccharide biosynthesis protein SpsF
MGHIARSRSIAHSFREAGWKPVFVCQENDVVRNYLKNEQVELPSAISQLKPNVVVADLSHRENAANPNGAAAYFDELKRTTGAYLVIIDGNQQECISARAESQADMIVLPYVGRLPKVLGAPRVLSGPEYVIMSPPFQEAARKSRFIQAATARVLISMGGTDPFGLTERAVRAASVALPNAEVRIVIGPGFSESTVSRIEAATTGDARFALIRSAQIAQELMESDVAIISDGLTKYEAAVTGTPAIVVCYDEHQRALSADFEKTRCCAYFGPEDLDNPKPLTELLTAICDDLDRRRRMSESGKQLLDGKGGERIVTEITKELFCYGTKN